MVVTVQVKVISNRLPRASAKVRSFVSAEVKKATLEIQAKAQELVPVKTGTLRRSITSQFPTDLSGVVGTSVFYGQFVEFGTRRMGARPYLRPAAEAVLPGFSGRVAAALRSL